MFGSLGLLIAIAAGHAKADLYARAFGPRQVVRLARPTISWEVWADQSFTRHEMRLNGNVVEAHYDDSTRTLIFTPSEPLKAGEYTVQAKSFVNGGSIEKNWSFTVAANALAEVPEPDADAKAAFQAINQLRSKIGLPPFKLEPSMCAAGKLHCEYLIQNRLVGHYEDPAKPGFLGVTPQERLFALGYAGESWEILHSGGDSIAESLQLLFDAPYHRQTLLQPGNLIAGSAWVQDKLSITTNIARTSELVVSPFDGQTDVPLMWNGKERPNPLRLHNVSGAVGYPIVLSLFSPNWKPISLVSASLKRGGEEVPLLINHPQNDEQLKLSIILIPREPLKPESTYSVQVDFKDGDGKDQTKQWTFKTKSGQRAGS